MNTDHVTISDRLKHIYSVTNSNGSKLAELTGIPKPTIYNLEKGKTSSPNTDFLVALEEKAGISMLWFTMGIGPVEVKDREGTQPESWQEKENFYKEIISSQKSRISDLEFIAKLYRSEKAKEDKAFANFNTLAIGMSPVYTEENVILFSPIVNKGKVMEMHPEGYTGGDEVALLA